MLGVDTVARRSTTCPDGAVGPRVRLHARGGQRRAAARVRDARACAPRSSRSAGYGEAGRRGPAGRARAGRARRRARHPARRTERPGRRVDARRSCARRSSRPYPPRGPDRDREPVGQLRVVVPELGRADRRRREPRGRARATRPRSTIADYLDCYADDDATAVSLAYVEGVTDGRALFERARARSRARKPRRAREGRHDRGRAARRGVPHRRARRPTTRVFDGMCRQAGVTRAATVEEAFEAAATFATQPLPARPARRGASRPRAAGASSPPTPIAALRQLELAAAARRPARRDRREAAAALEPQQPDRPRGRRDPRHDPRGARARRRAIPTSTRSCTSASASSRTRRGCMRDGPLLPRPRPRAHRRVPRAPGRALRRRPRPTSPTRPASRSSPRPSSRSPRPTTPGPRPCARPAGSATRPRNRAVTALEHLWRVRALPRAARTRRERRRGRIALAVAAVVVHRGRDVSSALARAADDRARRRRRRRRRPHARAHAALVAPPRPRSCSSTRGRGSGCSADLDEPRIVGAVRRAASPSTADGAARRDLDADAPLAPRVDAEAAHRRRRARGPRPDAPLRDARSPTPRSHDGTLAGDLVARRRRRPAAHDARHSARSTRRRRRARRRWPRSPTRSSRPACGASTARSSPTTRRYDATARTLPDWTPNYVPDGEIGALGALIVDGGFADPTARTPSPIPRSTPAASSATLLAARGVTIADGAADPARRRAGAAREIAHVDVAAARATSSARCSRSSDN